MPLRSIAFLLYFLGSSAGALVFPFAGVLCYIALYHIYPQTTWWGGALRPLGIRYAYVCGLCLLVGSVLNLNRLKFGHRFLHPVEYGCLLVFAMMLLSGWLGTTWNYESDFVVDKMWKVFLFVFLLGHVVVTRRQLWYLVLLFAILALYLGHEAKVAPAGAFTNNRLDGIGGPDFRESTGLAIHLFALLPFVAIVLRQRPLWLKILAFLAACYAMNAVLLCRARSAFLAGVIASIFAVWYIPKRHRRWVICILAIATIGSATLSDRWFRERMSTIVSSAEERDQSAATRLTIWSASWRMFQEHPLGVGIGQFQRQIEQYGSDEELGQRDAHNTFILCLVETGVEGLAAFLIVVALSWGTLARLNRRVKSKLEDHDFLELVIFANRLGLLVYLVAGMFVSRFYTEGMWMLIALPVAVSRVVENEIRAQAGEEIYIESALPGWIGQRYGPQVALHAGGR